MLKLLVVAGARPNFMKVAPLLKACAAHPDRIDAVLVHTGQHYDDQLSKVFFQQLGMPEPAVNLGVGSGSHAAQTAAVMVAFEPLCLEHRPHRVVVVGDVNSTAACTLVAAKLNIPVAHVEAGLRSFDRTMPEEVNRVVTDALSDLLFVTEPSGVANLKQEGKPVGAIHLVGNVMVDTLLSFRGEALKSDVRQRLGLTGRYGLVTLHRPANVDDHDMLLTLLRALAQVGRDVPLVFPVHPRAKNHVLHLMNEDPVPGVSVGGDGRCGSPGVHLVDPQPYLDFLNLMSGATVVLTDSGGVQEETTVLGVPCLTLRDNTERPVTVDEGSNILVGRDPDRIVEEARKVLAGQGRQGRVPGLWDGKAAERIVAVLLQQTG